MEKNESFGSLRRVYNCRFFTLSETTNMSSLKRNPNVVNTCIKRIWQLGSNINCLKARCKIPNLSSSWTELKFVGSKYSFCQILMNPSMSNRSTNAKVRLACSSRTTVHLKLTYSGKDSLR